MIIGVPKEIKNNENRVALTPAGVVAFCKAGHQVVIEKNAGVGSGISNEEYIAAGAGILATPEEVYTSSEMIMKVKEPIPVEYELFNDGQLLFTYLHLAPEPALTAALLKKNVVGIAYETVQPADGSLPLLIPMSEVAGRMAIQIGVQFLEKPHGGRGILLGGVPGVTPAKVTIVGGGIVGINAAKMAIDMGADVTILDVSNARLRYLDDIFGARIKIMMSNRYNIMQAVAAADLLVGAVLIPGAKAPKFVTEEMVKGMKQGSLRIPIPVIIE